MCVGGSSNEKLEVSFCTGIIPMPEDILAASWLRLAFAFCLDTYKVYRSQDTIYAVHMPSTTQQTPNQGLRETNPLTNLVLYLPKRNMYVLTK